MKMQGMFSVASGTDSRCARWLGCILALSTACSLQAPERDQPPRSGQVTLALPSLLLDTVTNNPAGDDLRLGSPIAVGPQGDLLFSTPRFDPVIQLLLRADRTRLEFARRGDGPGEARSPTPTFVSDSEVVVLDGSLSRITRWSRHGEFKRSTRLRRPVGNPIAHLSEGQWLGSGLSHDGFSLLAIDDHTGSISEIVPPSDSFIAAHFPDERSVVRNRPALGAWSGGLALGDTRAYAIALYDWSGRRVTVIHPPVGPNLPTEDQVQDRFLQWQRSGRPGGLSDVERLKEIRTTPMPWFANRVRVDSKGRMWVVGTTGDSVFADLYAADHPLGRLQIPCRRTGGRWDLNGSWFAIVCLPDDERSDADAVVKLFRLVG